MTTFSEMRALFVALGDTRLPAHDVHLANAGLPVLLLDMPAKEGPRSAVALTRVSTEAPWEAAVRATAVTGTCQGGSVVQRRVHPGDDERR